MKKKITKKQKIKVPAYKDAGTIDVGAELAGGLDHATVGMELPDKLQPSYDYNLDVEPKMNTTKAAAIAEGAMTGLTSIANSAFGTSGVTTSKQAAAKSISDTLSSAGTGMKIGGIFGPLGAGIGAAAGALIGAIGQKGKKAEMQSFTDYDEGTLGTGFIGAFQNDDLLAERKRIKQNAYANKDAVRGTNYLQNEYLQKYGGMSTGTFAEGGTIPSRHVYVDDGELIKTPQGETLEVPEEGKPTDSNLVNLPVGSRILSDSLKVPGTKKTFAQLGKELMNRRTSKGTDKYAENSKMLNDRNDQITYDRLFELQEQVKQQKGIKPKTKSVGIPAANTGLEVKDKNTRNLNEITKEEIRSNPHLTFAEKMALLNEKNRRASVVTKVGSTRKSQVDHLIQKGFNTVKGTPMDTYNSLLRSYIPYEEFEQDATTNVSNEEQNVNSHLNEITEEGKDFNTSNRKTIIKPVQLEDVVEEDVVPSQRNFFNEALRYTHNNINAKNNSGDYNLTKLFDVSDFTANNVASANDLDKQADLRRPELEKEYRQIKNAEIMHSIGNVLSQLGELTPTFMNLFEDGPEKVQANYNPYSTAITNTLGNRRYNIDKERQEILENRALANRNVARTNTNTGANLAYALNSALQNEKNIANAYRYADNVNAQYAKEYADAMNNLGQQWVAETNGVQEKNAANKAAIRNIRKQGATQMSNWLQRNRAEKNKRDSDLAMLNLYKPFLEAGTPRENMSEFLKYYNKLSSHQNFIS